MDCGRCCPPMDPPIAEILSAAMPRPLLVMRWLMLALVVTMFLGKWFG